MLLVRINYRKQADAKEVHYFSAKVESPLDAIQLFYDQHPHAAWIGIRSIPLLEEAV